MQRISVVGNSGSGKTTLAVALAETLGLPMVELDAEFHQPGWEPRPTEEFRARVATLTAGPRWIVDGNYSAVVRDLVWARADTVVWLDLPRWRVVSQLVPRTVGRAVTRRELWNGNREPFTGMFRWDPERSILRWSWTRHRVYRTRYEAAMEDPAHTHLRFVRLGSRAEIARFIGGLSPRPGDGSAAAG